jgi:Phytochelatin synthase
MGTERFARSAVNPSVLKVLGYFETESRLTFCGPTSLAIAMNSLGLNDPTPPSLFPYHLVTQQTVFTPANLLVKSYDEVDRSGLMLDQLARFAKNLKLQASVLHAADLSASDLRARLIAALGQPDSRVIVNFNRASLGQEGEGHFSPLVAYDAISDSFLILDVARYKYPPAWVDYKDLDTGMRAVDPASGLSRGVLIVTRPAAAN